MVFVPAGRVIPRAVSGVLFMDAIVSFFDHRWQIFFESPGVDRCEWIHLKNSSATAGSSYIRVSTFVLSTEKNTKN
jgi:hypothetical protein